MVTGLATTFELLAETDNEAAVDLLILGLDSSVEAVREQALRTLLARRSPEGQRAIVRRLHAFSEEWRAVVLDGHGRLSLALRDAILSRDSQFCTNGCQAIVAAREYDLVQTLITALEDETNPYAELAGQTLLTLVESLYEELAGPRDYRHRRDPQLVRKHVHLSLEQSVQRFSKHKRTEVLEAYLLLASRDDALLKQVLMDPLHAAYRPLTELLSRSPRAGIVRLVLSYLDDAQAPSSALGLLGYRQDARFLELLLRRIGREPASAARTNLSRIEIIPWLRPDQKLILELDEPLQHSAVQMLVCSGMKRSVVLQTLSRVLREGKPAGRRAAVEALEAFSGADANLLVLHALDDADPLVHAAALKQLRPRSIPAALTLLVERLNHPQRQVKDAACACLAEFNFRRFLASFDILDDDVRRSTGQLVAKVDREAQSQLLEEIQSLSRRRRLRALSAAEAMDFVSQIEEAVCQRLLEDEDHLVRNAAAHALGQCTSARAQTALQSALTDRAPLVQETAAASLQRSQQGGAPAPLWLPPAPAIAGEAADVDN